MRKLRALTRVLVTGLMLSAITFGVEAAQSSHLTISGGGQTQAVSLEQNKSMIIDFGSDIGEVIVSQPEVAGAILRSKRRAIIQGTGSGNTNIFFMDTRGQTLAVLDLKVVTAPSTVGNALQDTLRRVLPGSSISVESVSLGADAGVGGIDRVVLSGTAQSSDDVNKAIAIAAQFAGGPDNVASVINVAGSQQVMLKVTVAEVNRETLKQLGINLNASLNAGGMTVGLVSNNALNTNGVSIGGTIGNLTLEAELRALEQRGAVRLLAEPTLTSISGQPADFLAGGEFPTLSGIQDGERTFTYRDFGVKLQFTPTVKNNGIIGLAVETEVSEIASGGFDTGSGIIPGFNTRRAKTSVELPNGATLSIAGLIEDKLRQQIAGVPGLGHIPILGALFRSREFVRSQTELVILVTPYLAQASFQEPVLPTDRAYVNSDAEAVFLGKMETNYGVAGGNGMRGAYDGTFGFVLD